MEDGIVILEYCSGSAQYLATTRLEYPFSGQNMEKVKAFVNGLCGMEESKIEEPKPEKLIVVDELKTSDGKVVGLYVHSATDEVLAWVRKQAPKFGRADNSDSPRCIYVKLSPCFGAKKIKAYFESYNGE